MTYAGPGAVRHPHAACVDRGCQLPRMMNVVDQAGEALRQTGRQAMSQALWCDQGGHAFSERDPGRQRITVDVIDEDTEQQTQMSKDFCGECAKTSGLSAPRKTRPAIVKGTTDD